MRKELEEGYRFILQQVLKKMKTPKFSGIIGIFEEGERINVTGITSGIEVVAAIIGKDKNDNYSLIVHSTIPKDLFGSRSLNTQILEQALISLKEEENDQ